ncbi:plexin-B [Anopheles darlingi]|uniref:plexin-B n=1 Tax=Anopheles darlingi TaxID=43151 RepID=UPI00210066DE|nr:plexin-B [Anopheles darlingi]XP_049538872.1 plexin-B [Anopheles darlingi]
MSSSMHLLLRLILLRLVSGMLPPLDAVLKAKQSQSSSAAAVVAASTVTASDALHHHTRHSPLDDIVARYRLSVNGSTASTHRFTHLTYDPSRRMFYAGATNRILQLNENLTLLREAVTGPKLDSAQCHAAGCPQDEALEGVQETDNHNKVLLYNRDGDTLIACGSVHQGACEIYYLSGRFPESVKPIEVALAANDESSSTYAFIGPSRYQSWKREDIMYVGTTFTNVGDYRHDVPAISSRRLDDLTYAEFSIQQSNINIDVKYRDHFLVNYVYGFNSSEYAYFVLVQKKSHLADEAGFVTRLARICVNDPNYDSYTEVTITCMANGTDYNILRDAKLAQAGQKLSADMGIKRDDYLLVAVFSPAKEITDEPQNRSAICMYSLKDIEEVFNENIHSCFNGTIKDRNLGYISGTINDGKCPVAGSLGNIFSFCHVGLKISGVTPVIASAKFGFGEGVALTSIAVTNIGPHTLAFVGSNDGWIRKVLLSGREAGEYERLPVDGDGMAILPDTMFAPTNDHLYVLSERSVIKMKVEHCGTFGNCSACLESRDPYCGWCSLEKRCTVRTACQKDTSAARWLSIGTGQQCIDFEMVAPDRLPIGQMSVVRLVIKTLPELPHNAQYRCVFGNATPIDANVTKEGLLCPSPPVNERPTIGDGQDHVLVPLSVRSSETNKDFVSRSFAFYDCTRHDTCRKCLVSNWGCHWCIYDNRCAFNTSSCRNSANIVQSEGACPRLRQRSGPILLPNKVPKEIRLEIENLPRPQSAHTGFLCTVNIEGAHMVLPARVEANKYIVCEKTLYSYEAATNEYEATVDVNWNRNHYIDTVTVVLYKCEILGSHRDHADCSLCVTRDPKYQCTWCGQQCSFNETCNDVSGTGMVQGRGRGSVGLAGLGGGEESGCPRPRIDLIKPLSGPIEGGTLVTIEGSNLGIREEDVRGRIHIGEVPCELERYEISVRIECRTGAVGTEMSAPVKVGNEAGYTMSSVEFRYRDVKLEGLSPTMGPQSGGTKLAIIGRHLNVGTSAVAYLDDYECRINRTQASSSRLTCVTSAARSPEHIRILTLRIDGANRTLACSTGNTIEGQQQQQRQRSSAYGGGVSSPGAAGTYHSRYETCSVYNYTVDPKIMQIKPLKSFLSGGRMMTVHGTNLDAIQMPEIEVYLNDERLNRSTCVVLNSNQMECPSPSVREAWSAVQQQQLLLRNFSATAGGNNEFTQKLLASLVSADGRPALQQQQTGIAPSAMPVLLSSQQYPLAAAPTPMSGTAASSPAASAYLPSDQQLQLLLQINFLMDNVMSVRNLPKHFQNLRSSMVYVEDPVYQAFPSAVKLYKGDTLVIEGEHLNAASDETDVNVTIGTAQCNVTSLAPTQLVCTPPLEQPAPTDENGVPTAKDLPLVVVRVGRNLRFPIGFLKYDLIKPYAISHILFGVIVSGIFFVFSLLIILLIYRRKSTQAEREYKRIQIQMDTLESNVRMECKQAFAELQTDMTDLTADLESAGTPTLDLVNYVMKVFFPGVSDHPVLLVNGAKQGGHHHPGHHHAPHPHQRTNYDQAMVMFEQLINNRVFLLLFIDTLEAQKTFSIRDKVNVASLLMIVLMNQMDYVTDILKSLLLRLIEKSVMTKHPQLMLRRTESVVEKMLTNYMALCMYDYLRNYAGNSLFLLYKAIKHQIEKGLVDAVTHDARYSLSEERLLREQIAHSIVSLHIIQDDLDEKVQCKVLDCDTISQVKGKILDALFKNTPFSLRPSVHDLDLEWRHGRGGHLVLRDEDVTTKTVHGWKRLNTLAHYGVKESAVMSLVARPHDGYNTPGRHIFPYCYYINNPPAPTSNNHHPHHLSSSSSPLAPGPGSGSGMSGTGTLIGGVGPHNTDTLLAGSASHHHHHHHHHHHAQQQQQQQQAQQQQSSSVGVFHLVKPMDDRFSTLSSYEQHGSSSSGCGPGGAGGAAGGPHSGVLYGAGPGGGSHHKAIPEIFLTRLLATKGTIQKFVDDLFATILTVNEALPPAVKWLYDLLDAAARHHGIQDPEVLHAWKSNGLPLRFWVNFIKNPDFIFDIHKTPSVDVCLSVIAQTFMDACLTTEYRLGKDSPSNKLLFAKDLPQYREMVSNFYADIAMMPQISDQEMRSAMQRLSIHQQQFDTLAALKELYIYVSKYRLQIKEVLDMDLAASKCHLAHKLDLIAATLEDDECKTIDYYE